MTDREFLEMFLAAADRPSALFAHGEVLLWPAGMSARLRRSGLLRESGAAPFIQCPNCAEHHAEPLECMEDSSGRARWYILCPESMRVEVDPEHARSWEIDPDALAGAVGRALDVKGSPRPVVEHRLWRIGRIPWKGATREVVMARRLGDDDAASVAAHVPTSGRTIVLVPHEVPDDRLWPGVVPPIAPLSRLSSFEGDALSIDGVAFLELVEAADAAAERRSVLPADPVVRRKVLKRQVKAAIDGLLEHDVLVAAFVEMGSVRKAASLLTEKLGRPISKDAVQRAVERAGGRKNLLRCADSASVSRTVASQQRDRATKTAIYRK